LSLKLFVLGLIGLATPLLAQSTTTGPQGYAEPKIKTIAIPEVGVAPAPTPDNTFNIQLSSGGVVSILLRPDKAPNAVERVKTLANRH
jgi:hypothetical protein